MFAGGIINALIAAFVPPGVPWHVLPLMVFTLGSSLVMPSLTLILLDLFPTMRGMASSLQGFAQFALSGFNAGTIAPLLARLADHAGRGHAVLHLRKLCALARLSARRDARPPKEHFQ